MAHAVAFAGGPTLRGANGVARCVTGAADQTASHPGLEESGPLATSPPLSDDYGIQNRFLVLHIKGQLTRDFCLERGWPGGHLDRVAKLTANQLIGPDSAEASLSMKEEKDELYTDKSWLQTIQPDINRKAIGWASYDDTNLRVENTGSGSYIAGDRPRVIYALRLSKARNISVFVTLYHKVDIYALLYVAECEARIGNDLCFERVGVGRMIEARFAGGTLGDILVKDNSFGLV